MMLNKLSLNTIGLNRIGLNRIGKPSRGSSVRPYIDPEVLASLKAVCICYGKSNDDPDRAIVENLVDPDNPFVISNAAYKLNSGYGLYGMDFLEWKSNSGMSFTSTKLTSTKPNLSGGWLTFRNVSGLIPETKVKVSRAPREFGFIANNNGTDDRFSVTINNGVYTIPEFTLSSASGFYINNNSGDWSNLVIEQIPSYQGAFVTDGIDDLITSTKTVQEMLGGSNECTIVSMMWNLTSDKYTYNNQIRPYESGYIRSGFVPSSGGKLSISGYTISINYNANVEQSSVANVDSILGDKADFNRNVSGGKLDGKFSVEGYLLNNGGSSEQSQVAWYWTIIANKVLTTDQINQVIAYFNLDRCVEPTVLYDVKRQGLSNDTPDSDWYLKDYSGNGYDMTLYNYAKTPESGINEGGGLQSDGVEDYGKVTGLPIYKDYTVVADYQRVGEIVEGKAGSSLASKSASVGNGAFLFNIVNTNTKTATYSFGEPTSLSIKDYQKGIYYQSKYVNNGKNINSGTGIDYDSMWLGVNRDNSTPYFSGAIYSLMTFPYSMSEFLIERQLKKHKLGTLYPDMVEFRPIVNSNVKYQDIIFRNTSTGEDLVAGQYYDLGTISIFIKPLGCDEATAVKVNNVDAEFNSYDKNSGYYRFDSVVTKSPQKIDITIDEYIRYEDIVQPYPEMWVITQNAKKVSWGDKLKVGSEFGYNSKVNLLSGLYSTANSYYNGKVVKTGYVLKVEKQMVFACDYSWIGGTNEPKCILSPSRLRIPNSSYKILGYIPDISGHGNHGKINNSAYAGMSGANGYTENLTTWRNNAGVNNAIITDNSVRIIGKLSQSWILNNLSGYNLAKTKFVVTGIPVGAELIFQQNTVSENIKITNGEEFTVGGYTATQTIGFLITKGLDLDWSNLVIRQIGEYEGAYCLDGVDDFITIPTTVGGKQVLMKVNWQNSPKLLYDQRGSGTFAILTTNEDDTTNSRIAYQSRNLGGKTYIDGIENNYIETYSLKLVTHNITITNPISGNVSPVIGCNIEKTSNFARMSLYDFMLFDEISTDEEILTLNKYIGIEPKVTLPPYYWDAYGRSNNEGAYDRALLLNLGKIPSNDASNALTAKNVAYSGDSGYGGDSTIYKFSETPTATD